MPLEVLLGSATCPTGSTLKEHCITYMKLAWYRWLVISLWKVGEFDGITTFEGLHLLLKLLVLACSLSRQHLASCVSYKVTEQGFCNMEKNLSSVFWSYSHLWSKMTRWDLAVSAVTVVLNANIDSCLESWLVWKTESVEADTVLANNASYNHWQLSPLGVLVTCVHRKVLLSVLDF